MDHQKVFSTFSKQKLGAQGEELICSYLQKKGFAILAQNFKIRGGEIDIIAQHNHVICCVEVKTRTQEYFNISEIITPSKQKHIIRTAHLFLLQHKLSPQNIILRFDVAIVKRSNHQDITYLENAFTQQDYL